MERMAGLRCEVMQESFGNRPHSASPAKAGSIIPTARPCGVGREIAVAREVRDHETMGPGFPHGTSPWAEGPREGESGSYRLLISVRIVAQPLRSARAVSRHCRSSKRYALTGRALP